MNDRLRTPFPESVKNDPQAAGGARPAWLNLSAKYPAGTTTQTPQVTVSLSGTGTSSTKAIAVDPVTPSTRYAETAGGTVFRNTSVPVPSPGIPLLLLQE